mmetsp:Transcript_10862/g.31113  ORF Transcript_10862/g.31113 Transcript_10862/m.31113 type:complete len:212 (+) Transcript_10862:736-1371(+)
MPTATSASSASRTTSAWTRMTQRPCRRSSMLRAPRAPTHRRPHLDHRRTRTPPPSLVVAASAPRHPSMVAVALQPLKSPPRGALPSLGLVRAPSRSLGQAWSTALPRTSPLKRNPWAGPRTCPSPRAASFVASSSPSGAAAPWASPNWARSSASLMMTALGPWILQSSPSASPSTGLASMRRRSLRCLPTSMPTGLSPSPTTSSLLASGAN